MKLWRKLFSQGEHFPKGFVIGVAFCGQISDNKKTPSTKNWARVKKHFNLKAIAKNKDNQIDLKMAGEILNHIVIKKTCLPDFKQKRGRTCIKKYKAPKGMITARKIGVANVIANIVPMTDRKVRRNEVKDLGTMSSIPLMSLEKRFMILPWGVVSKNDMGECMMLTNIFWWRYRDATRDPAAMAMEAKRMKIACDKPSAP